MDRILVRSAALRIVFVVVLVLVALAGAAHAAPAAPAAPLQAAEAPPVDARLSSALFTPMRTNEGLDWIALWVLTPDAAAEIDGGARRIVRFALPLANGEALEPTFGVVPRVEGGQVTGVVVDRAGLDGRTVRAVFHQRARQEGTIRLDAPVAAGSTLQILDGDLGGGTRLEVETGRSLERAVGHVAPPGTSHAARDEARRLTGYEARVTGAPVYVRGDDVTASGGLRASVVTARARGHRGWMAMGVLFVGLVAALLVAMRKLRHAASVERADAILAADLHALETSAR
jgi:hypothetical protein